MPESFSAVTGWILEHYRSLIAVIAALVAGGFAALLVAEVLGRLDRGGRESVGRLITFAASLILITLASATIASRPFANTTGTKLEELAPISFDAPLLPQFARRLHPADYAYLSVAVVFVIGAGRWAAGRRNKSDRFDNPETSRRLVGAGALLFLTLWVFQRGVEQLKPEPQNGLEFFGTFAGAGVLAMAIVQGLRTLLPLRGIFHRVTLERWIDDATAEVSTNTASDDTARPRWWQFGQFAPSVDGNELERRERIFDSITRLARGPVSTDRYALLDLPIEQLCGQIAAGADRLLDAPFAATLETRGAGHEPASVKSVLLALAAGGGKDVDAYLTLADQLTATARGPELDAAERPAGTADSDGAAREAVVAAPPTLPDTQEYVRLRAGISQRIQRNIDGLQISTTFWWRRVVRGLVFSICGVFGLSVFNGRVTYTVMCAIVGGFVATAARDLIAVVEKARR